MGYEVIYWLGPIGSALALIVALILAIMVLKEDEGTKKMREVAAAVKEGAAGYLAQQYKIVLIVFAVLFCVFLYMVHAKILPWPVPYAFLSGGLLSALAGFIGMKIATNSSARTANAARKSLNKALRIAFFAGSVMGLTVVGLALLHISGWYKILEYIYRNDPDKLSKIAMVLLASGMGASTQALFARVGGGIYTKAADVGADLVGKVEAGIPEDDPRNPATIADNVGDNVGDVAGMGADLYESYVGSIVAAISLGVAAYAGSYTGSQVFKWVFAPLAVAGIGVIASVIGVFLVRAKEDASQRALLWALRKGIWSAAGLMALGSFILFALLGSDILKVYPALLSGLVAGIIIGYSAEYFTSDNYKPVKGVAKAATTGPATVILEGLSVGMASTWIPVITVFVATLAAFLFGGGAKFFVTGDGQALARGLYGVGLAAVGMLSTLGVTLASDAYGPVADNAGGNAEMAGLPPQVRERTDALDALGNTTAATGKGFAIGSAALTALALIASYKDAIQRAVENIYGSNAEEILVKLLGPVSVTNPIVISGILIGAMLPFLFSSMAISAVGRAAQKIIEEVRRQFREIKGLLEGKAKPEYDKAVAITTAAAQREMILPSLLAILTPIAVGYFLGPKAVFGLLLGALASGFSMAIFMANAGAAWDNGKKYIEKGNFGGKGTDAHKASVVGDTVGDPFKDTAGPSLNILIKLMSMVSIVFAGFVVKFNLLKLLFK